MHYSANVRLLACDRCGAPLETANAGRRVTCRYCQAVHLVEARDESVLAPPRRAPVPERERLERLRQQDRQGVRTPTGIAGVLTGGLLAPWKEAEAITMWRAARIQARSGSIDAGETLLRLTVVLADYFSRGGGHDPARHRAMCESALDALTLPRHRQVMRGMLCRAACDEGDTAAAEAWLAPCDPSSDDLEADSAYRVSRAYLDTKLANFAEVKRHVAAGVPILDPLEPLAILLHANAWERTGDVAEAMTLLSAFSGQAMELRILHEQLSSASLRLCPTALLMMHLPEPPPPRVHGALGLGMLLAVLALVPPGIVWMHLYVLAHANEWAASSMQMYPDNVVMTATVLEVMALGIGLALMAWAVLELSARRTAHRAARAASIRDAKVVDVAPVAATSSSAPTVMAELVVSIPHGRSCLATLAVPAAPDVTSWLRPGAPALVQFNATAPGRLMVAPAR